MLLYGGGPHAEEAQENWCQCPLPTKHLMHAVVSLIARPPVVPAVLTLSIPEILHTATIANFLRAYLIT